MPTTRSFGRPRTGVLGAWFLGKKPIGTLTATFRASLREMFMFGPGSSSRKQAIPLSAASDVLLDYTSAISQSPQCWDGITCQAIAELYLPRNSQVADDRGTLHSIAVAGIVHGSSRAELAWGLDKLIQPRLGPGTAERT